MVRGMTVLLILNVFSQSLSESVFDKFSIPDKMDKNKMLMYLRGKLKSESTIDAKVTTDQYGYTPSPDSIKIKQLWEGKALPDRSDKSKMLAYLRGMPAPYSINVYEDPQHQGGVVETQNTENKQNTADTKNPEIDSNLKTQVPQVSWGNAAAVTQPTILHPQKESDSDTCFWRGQQAPENAYSAQMVQGDPGQVQLRDNTADIKTNEFENVGENVIKFWECVKYKLLKSFDKLKAKVCGMFS